jgi:hypothetical protein
MRKMRTRPAGYTADANDACNRLGDNNTNTADQDATEKADNKRTGRQGRKMRDNGPDGKPTGRWHKTAVHCIDTTGQTNRPIIFRSAKPKTDTIQPETHCYHVTTTSEDGRRPTKPTWENNGRGKADNYNR